MVKKKAIKTRDKYNNIFFIAIVMIILVVIVLLSFKINSGTPTKRYQAVAAIGVNEFEVSLVNGADSIIFFCDSNEIKCYDELTALNELVQEEQLYIEYLNIAELVDEEKEKLSSLSSIFASSYYPHLIIIKNKEIVNNSNDYLSKEEILELFRNLEIIK